MTEFATYPSLKDLPVLITGGASGIGAATVEAFARQGAKVGFVDFDETAAQTLLARLAPLNAQIAFAACDLRDLDNMKAAFAEIKARIGAPLVLVNNAARDDRHGWEDVTPDYWDERMNTNLRHQFFAIQALAPGMIAAGQGSIINLGSISWMLSMGGMPAYTTAKAAIQGLTKSFAADLGKHHIRVNCIAPGWIMTERQKALWLTPEAEAAYREKQILPELIDPVYLANMVLFLASADSAMCTAQTFIVDGGMV
ncbi:SDR family NAD(P)-dependent oxidoreductase [Pacificoceanicola onchidii]|uniref:SDR family NAD(P)-dependent oxidoreductase n=1 Tax=Pacificoceanicola onchidii TaxID=2562685 RepID=UPI0010A58E36|nr:SDR family NAD(P)-dependent oxidoreductase [Pacificoceanicola onchidii]